MGPKSYLAIIVLAVGLILLNMLYGHHVYGSPYDQSLSKYSVYVHLQSGWASAPANIIYDITVSWNGNPELDAPPPHNTNTLRYQSGREVVVLEHGFSDCDAGWSPPLYRYGADMLRGAITYAGGEQLNLDPYVPLYPDTPNESYSGERQAVLVEGGYAQFVPVCTHSEHSSFVYSVNVNDPHIAFDVHFVPSGQELHDYFGDGLFQEYESCGASNRQKYTGYCDNVAPGSGLLVVLPDTLERSLTRVQVSMQETTSSPGA